MAEPVEQRGRERRGIERRTADRRVAGSRPEPATDPRPGVGLVCSDPLRCLGLEVLLREMPEIRFVQFGEVDEMDLAGLQILVLDRESNDDALRLLRTFQQMRSVMKVIVLGPTATHEQIQTVIGAGAKGYLGYEAGLDEVRMALRIVADGSVWAPRKVMARLLETAQFQATGGPAGDIFITPREHEVLQLVSQGQSNSDIAATLSLDVGTVKTYISRLMRKAGVGNRTALAMHALSHRLMVRDPSENSQ